MPCCGHQALGELLGLVTKHAGVQPEVHCTHVVGEVAIHNIHLHQLTVNSVAWLKKQPCFLVQLVLLVKYQSIQLKAYAH